MTETRCLHCVKILIWDFNKVFERAVLLADRLLPIASSVDTESRQLSHTLFFVEGFTGVETRMLSKNLVVVYKERGKGAANEFVNISPKRMRSNKVHIQVLRISSTCASFTTVNYYTVSFS